jgi:hypothetical protein
MTITLTVKNALNLLGPTLPAAETDNLLPALCAVQLTRDNNTVRAVATDRYIAAIAEADDPIDDEDVVADGEILLPVDLVKGILTLAKKNKSQFGFVAFNDDGKQVTADTHGGSVTAPAINGMYPKVQTLVDHAVKGAPDAGSPMNIHTGRLAKLAAITKAAGKHANLCLQSTGEHKPILFDVTDRSGEVVVFGMVMVQRLEGTVASRIRAASA